MCASNFEQVDEFVGSSISDSPRASCAERDDDVDEGDSMQEGRALLTEADGATREILCIEDLVRTILL